MLKIAKSGDFPIHLHRASFQRLSSKEFEQSLEAKIIDRSNITFLGTEKVYNSLSDQRARIADIGIRKLIAENRLGNGGFYVLHGSFFGKIFGYEVVDYYSYNAKNRLQLVDSELK